MAAVQGGGEYGRVIHQRNVKKLLPPVASLLALAQPSPWRGADYAIEQAGDKYLKYLVLVRNCFVGRAADETILAATKPFLAFGAELPKPLMVIKRPTNSGAKRQGRTGDSQMRTISLILAFAFVVAGTSMAGSAENGLPGIGTFSYNGSPVTASHTLVVAAR
jgi:hypothetical protein